jgi:hypothetical protein
MKWAEHVAQIGEMRNVCNILVGKLERKIYMRIILKLISNRVRKFGLDSSGSGHGTVVDRCEHINESSGCMEVGIFVE